MKARLLLIFFSLSSLLQDGLTESVFTGPEGGSITVSCSFSFSGKKKLFCRKSCEDGDVLIETDKVSAQRDRYSIRYEEGFYPRYSTFVNVTIKQLKKSDSGKYTCRLTGIFVNSNERVEIIVTDTSPSSTPNRPVEPSPTSLPAATTTAPTSSSPETSEQSSAPTSSSPETSEQSSAPQITPVLLTVSVIIIIIFIITLSVTVVVFCRNRTSKHTESPEPPDEDEVEAEYEEVADVRVTSSSSVEQFELYSLAQFSDPNRT